MEVIKSLYLCVMAMLLVYVEGSNDCYFEYDFCQWRNEGWRLTPYTSQSALTGPMDLINGSYIYLDTFDEGVFEATLTSPATNVDRQCFVFRYHMKGVDTIGNLTIRISSMGSIIIFGHQSNNWRCGIIFLPSSGVSIQMTGYRHGTSDYGLIALDALTFMDSNEESCITNVYMSTQDCEGLRPIPTSPTVTTPTTATTLQNEAELDTSDNWPDYMIYVISVPCGVLVISIIAIIAGVSYKKRKKNTYQSSAELRSLSNPRHEYHRPSEASSERYPDVFGNKNQQDTEVYDYIDEKLMTDDDYLTPTNNDEGYTILPAITKQQSQYDRNYVEPRDLNIPNKQGKKISISDQGDVQYTDVRNHGQPRRIPSKVYTITQDYLDMMGH